MANAVDLTGLTLNPKESTDLMKFVFEQVYARQELRRLHGVHTGVTMKEQIVFASQFGKTGIKSDATCTRKSSDPTSVMTQKYWEPVGIEDTLIHCNKELNGLFKAYFDKIQRYIENYEIEGSELETMFAIMLEEAVTSTVWRAAWYADTTVAAAGAAAPGLVAAGNVQFYDYFDGLWEQIFAAVTATTLSRYTIALNSQVTPAAQLALTANLAKDTYFESVWGLADPRLKAHPDITMYVSNAIWENYRQSLQAAGENSTIEYTQEGFRQLKWNGVPVVNMETVWDVTLFADFVDNTTNNAYYLPNRIVLTVPQNIPIATLNDNDFSEFEGWYEKKEREYNLAYGFSLDSKLLEEYMAVVAY